MRVRLTRKLATEVDGIDLSTSDVGEVIELPGRKAQVLIAERWAVAERRSGGPERVIAFRRETDPGHHHDDDEVLRPA